MKKVLFTLLVALITSATVQAASPQTTVPASGSAVEKGNNIAPRNDKASKSGKEAQGKSAKARNEQKQDGAVTASAAPISNANTNSTTDGPQPKAVTTVPTSGAASSNDPSKKAAEAGGAKPSVVPTSANPAALMNIYRVGVGDILDIRLLNTPARESTLYTVLPGGILEYPLAGDPLKVGGMTSEEIAARLQSLIRLYDHPQVAVNVREYASHTVIVTGLVNDPGMKVLRREAVPLYVVVTEAQPRPEASRATIMRQGSPNVSVDLTDTQAMATPVLPGDVIRLAPQPPQFFFIGGAINSPGQKNFHSGLTLTQAVLASGGATRFAGSEVKVSRQGADGRLVTTKYNLKKIEEGKVPDPLLQAGDRIEVSRGGW